MEGDPARAREARLPGLRSDYPAAGSLASDCAGACRAQAAGPCPVAKYGLHLPLNRQSDVYQPEGIDLDVSTLADWVGASAATLMPLVDAIRSTSSQPSASMRMTPQCRSWPRARPGPAGSGPMCATTARLPVQIRRRPCTLPLVAACIRSSIWRAMLD
nr:hypothetical 61.7 kDa protein y4HP [Bradyrhizobium sp. DOA9]